MRNWAWVIVMAAGLHMNALGQKVVSWDLLAVPYSTTPEGLYAPQFPSWLDSYKNQEVVLQGYLVPVDVATKQYALSRYAFSSCFFCGNAGPETVIEVEMDGEAYREYTDEQIKLKGVLRFVPGDMDSVMYKLEQAKLVE